MKKTNVSGSSSQSVRKSGSSSEIFRLTSMSILTALVVVLACLGSFIRVGPFAVTLTLCPIIIGAALFGPSAGAILGAVFGVVTIITGILGWDGGTIMLLMEIAPFPCVFICVLKTTVAGWLAGIVYRIFQNKTKLAVILAGIVCPVVNTGIFIAGMLIFWRETLESWAGGSDVVLFALTGLTGINFLVELTINMILATGITFIIKSVAGRK